ncbi:MAG: M28 family peptidase [Candidatus Zixiibacteriota bacterium]
MKVIGWILLGCALAGRADAVDIGFVAIDSDRDVMQARSVLSHAMARVGNRFLVAVDSAQQSQLAKGGLSWESVLVDQRLDDWYLLMSSHGQDATGWLAADVQAVRLDEDRFLVHLSSSTVKAIATEANLKCRELSDLSIRFTHQPSIAVAQDEWRDGFPSDSLALRVSQDSLYAFDSRLQAFYTRFFRTDSAFKARDWLVQKFQGWGYTQVTTQPVWVGEYWGTPCNCWSDNVMTIKPGWAEPEKIIVIGAHYDSYSQYDEMVHAPGADDNASGTSVVLEMARILKDIPLRKTIIFMPFGAEEIWMYGSYVAVDSFAAVGADIEVMYNYDMVGYEPNTVYNTRLQAGNNQAYLNVSVACASRVSSIVPWLPSGLQASDHTPFDEQGWPVVYTAEGDFNTPNYHQPTDSTSKLNFDYMTNIARMAAAALGYVGDAASPTPVDSIVDQGDGQGLTIHFGNVRSDYTYYAYRGTAPGVYNDSVPVTPGASQQLLTGLTQGVRYYMTVRGIPDGGYPAVYAEELSETPLLYPRIPASVSAEPQIGAIRLSWASNHEADLDHYELYRRAEFETEFRLIAGNLMQTTFDDSTALRWFASRYRVRAIDRTGLASDFSVEVASTPATFDHGILIADEMTEEYDFMPSQPELEAWYDTVLSGAPHGLVTVDDYADALKRPLAGQYSSIWWIDDDIGTKLLRYSRDTLRWYSGFTNDMLIAGYQTIPLFTPAPSPGHLLYDEFMLQSYALNYAKDFAGAKGVGGWPSVELDTTRGIKRMGDIPSLTPRAGATIIYQYDSNIDDPGRENTPVGIAYDGPRGKRVLLSFPLWYMTPGSVQALMSAVKSYFGETGQAPAGGDLDGSGFVDIGDLVALVDFIFFGVPVPNGPASADTDGSCVVDITDLQRLIDYLFFGSDAPVSGCAH